MSYILYHGNCWDGFGAAWAAKGALEGSSHIYVPVSYGQPIPNIPDNQNVYILDFSYPADILLNLAERSQDVVVLDHHASAQKDLAGLQHDRLYIEFDMTHSGAVLAWQYFLPDEPVTALLSYIEDRDLWLNKLPWSEAIHSYIQSYPRTFENYDMLNEMLNEENTHKQVIDFGLSILRFKNTKVTEICDQAFTQEWDDYGDIPIVNTSCFMSEVANELLERYPKAPFAAYYFDRPDDKVQWGLRSRKDFDCSEVAKQHGGGGHKQASGFVI